MKRAPLRASLLVTCISWFVCQLTTSSTWAQSAIAQTPNRSKPELAKEQTQFLRMRTVDIPEQLKAEPVGLDTAVVTYESAAAGPPVTVDLIGAVHMGEAGYYQELNRLFDGYEVVLYELVAPEGTKVPLGGKRPEAGFNPIGMLQHSAKNMLGLVDLLSNPLKMKRARAAEFTSEGSLDQALGGPLNQLLIVDRNAATLQALRQQLDAGKKRIAIFYGAAHLSDFEKHLIDDFGLSKTRQQWLTAWDLTTAQPPELNRPASLLLDLLREL